MKATTRCWLVFAWLAAVAALPSDTLAREAPAPASFVRPDSVAALVERLRQLEGEATTYPGRLNRDTQRRRIARRILALDPSNAVAHEALGRLHLYDYWRYRNAVALPDFRLTGRPAVASGSGRETAPEPEPSLGGGKSWDNGFSAGTPASPPEPDPAAHFEADLFDLPLLRQQRVPMLALSGRAQRAYARAVDHLEQARASDPAARGVYDVLMHVYALEGDFAAAANVVDGMRTAFPDEATTWLYGGLVHYRLGDVAAARVTFDTALDRMDDAERAAFTRLDPLLDEAELERYHDDPEAFAVAYWERNDPRLLTDANERRLAHLARMTSADLYFGSGGRRGWETDRGRILVRHGFPNEEVTLVPAAGQATLSSVMEDVLLDAGGEVAPRVVLRGAGGDRQHARQYLVDWRSRGSERVDESNIFQVWTYDDTRFVFEDPGRSSTYRLYRPPADDITKGVAPWENDYKLRAEAAKREADLRFAYDAPGRRRVRIPFRASVFKGDAAADVYVAYGLPVVQAPEPEATAVDVTGRAGAFLLDEGGVKDEVRRTLADLPVSQLAAVGDSLLWHDAMALSAMPGTHEVAMEFETAGGSTIAVERRMLDVPVIPEDGLVLSDLLLAYHVEPRQGGEPVGGVVVRRGLAITPAPWSTFDAGRPLYVYVEAYNLRRDAQGRTDFEVEVRLVPERRRRGLAQLFAKRDGREGVRELLPATGTSADDGRFVTVHAPAGAKGAYRLVLRVRDRTSGETAEREERLFLE